MAEQKTLTAEEQAALEQTKNFVGGLLESAKEAVGLGEEKSAEELAGRQVGELVIPDANPELGLIGWEKTQMRIGGFSSGDIDMIDDIKMRYPDLKLTGALKALHENPALKDEVMTMLRENENVPHHVAQQLQGNEDLTAQFEDLIRTDPDKFKSVLPQIEEHPEQFSEIIAGVARDPKTAAEANAEVSNDLQGQFTQIMTGLFTGKVTFSEVFGSDLGAQLGEFFGPIIDMIKGFIGSAVGFVTQNMPEDGIGREFVETMGEKFGVDFSDKVTDVAPQTPATTPDPLTHKVNQDNDINKAPGMQPS